jgi:hypothetical protein
MALPHAVHYHRGAGYDSPVAGNGGLLGLTSKRWEVGSLHPRDPTRGLDESPKGTPGAQKIFFLVDFILPSSVSNQVLVQTSAFLAPCLVQEHITSGIP